MSDLNKALEDIADSMGMQVSDTPQPQETAEPQNTDEPQPQEELVQEVQQQEASVETPPQGSLQEEEEISEEEMESTMLQYLSERLGREVSSFDEIEGTQNTSVEIDERVAAINDFVSKTGRDPQDWFTYQSMNPSEMDDLSAVKTQLKSQYGDLSNEDLNLLIDNKYKLDADMYDDGEVRLSQIQLKMDADKARQEIEGLRSQYAAPVREQEDYEGIINEDWVNNMSAEVDALDGIEFQVSKDKSFTFGLEDNYKSHLKSKNEQIEDFFGSYMDNQGQWDFEKWNMHQAVLDNIETIVKSAYSQGLGDGQRGLVDKAANVQYSDPSQVSNATNPNQPDTKEQIRQALGLNDNGLTINI
jgi:hypothetical protein